MRAHIRIHNICFITLIIVNMIAILLGCSTQDTIKIIEKESYYSDFVIEGDKVYIECELTVDNSSGEEVSVEFYADFPHDEKLGLLQNATIKGFQEDKNLSEFPLQKGKTRLRVVFIGDFAGTNQKHDRNLPDISVVPIEN